MLDSVKTVEKAEEKVVEKEWKRGGKSCEKDEEEGVFRGKLGESLRFSRGFKKISRRISTRWVKNLFSISNNKHSMFSTIST